jgi:nucleoside-diphosphate-sugar epimerase
MKLLVLGGSYFYGRVFTMLAVKETEYELTLFNRGTYSMEEYGVKQITGDRHNPADLEKLKACGAAFDAVVDFCGYEKGDIRLLAEYLPNTVKQYILISTVDVYQRGLSGRKNETTPYETREIAGEAGEAGAYIRGKIALEQELMDVCGKSDMTYTILRPAILYGPYNYAPRESVYIQLALQNHLLPEITDAAGKFQFVYVKDAAKAVCKCLLKKETYEQSYNLCGEEVLDYEKFICGLEQAIRQDGQSPADISRYPMQTGQAQEMGIPLPFPVYEEETELYENEKSKRELGLSYTSFEDGIVRTYQAFKGVFG